MPQFDKITFFNQIFWLIFFFCLFFILYLKNFLPYLSIMLKFRAKNWEELDTLLFNGRYKLIKYRSRGILLRMMPGLKSGIATFLGIAWPRATILIYLKYFIFFLENLFINSLIKRNKTIFFLVYFFLKKKSIYLKKKKKIKI